MRKQMNISVNKKKQGRILILPCFASVPIRLQTCDIF